MMSVDNIRYLSTRYPDGGVSRKLQFHTQEFEWVDVPIVWSDEVTPAVPMIEQDKVDSLVLSIAGCCSMNEVLQVLAMSGYDANGRPKRDVN